MVDGPNITGKIMVRCHVTIFNNQGWQSDFMKEMSRHVRHHGSVKKLHSNQMPNVDSHVVTAVRTKRKRLADVVDCGRLLRASTFSQTAICSCRLTWPSIRLFAGNFAPLKNIVLAVIAQKLVRKVFRRMTFIKRSVKNSEAARFQGSREAKQPLRLSRLNARNI